MVIEKSNRLKEIPPYLFVEIDRLKKTLQQENKDLIDLGVGDPDLPPPEPVKDALINALQFSQNHRYPLDKGLKELRIKISQWMKERFDVDLDPEKEVLPLIGSKEGIAHLPLAIINQGDIALIPELLYPPYRSGVIFARGKIYYLELKEDNNFLPILSKIPQKFLKKAKLLYLNYPNNPTTATVEKEFLRNVVNFCLENNIIVIYDAAYSEITFDNYNAPSILEIEGAKEIAIEFHSFSKTYNMTGWRIGWACGNKDLINYLREVKSNIDSGIFYPIQYGGIKALEIYDEHIKKQREIYQKRRDIFIEGLKKVGWDIPKPKATFYIWAKCPLKISSQQFCKLLLEKAYIVATPGIGFGSSGEGWLRFSLTISEERLKEAVDRIAKLL